MRVTNPIRVPKLVKITVVAFFCFGLAPSDQLMAQATKIRGFVDVGAYVSDDKLNFELGEYDLFITSELHDRFSFLGETVFHYELDDKEFNVSVERVIIKYNYSGNHSLLIGKHHTPINYWNDSYHHGRVFFPTVDRPHLFEHNILPIHTTGVSLQGMNLGKLRFGYDFMVGNGIGSADVEDNDKFKSVTAAVHIKPKDNMRIGASYYNDVISQGSVIEGIVVGEKINQQLYSASFAYFGSKLEVLAEATISNNRANSTGSVNSIATYLYAGYRIKEKFVPYARIDKLNFQEEELYYINNDVTAFVTGLRYEINYLAVVKLEYQYDSVHVHEAGSLNRLKLQIAIGF